MPQRWFGQSLPRLGPDPGRFEVRLKGRCSTLLLLLLLVLQRQHLGRRIIQNLVGKVELGHLAPPAALGRILHQCIVGPCESVPDPLKDGLPSHLQTGNLVDVSRNGHRQRRRQLSASASGRSPGRLVELQNVFSVELLVDLVAQPLVDVRELVLAQKEARPDQFLTDAPALANHVPAVRLGPQDHRVGRPVDHRRLVGNGSVHQGVR
mmetsp:Transcript_9092/g.27008  ORF Transcript_9092/g.27008 Transcript_9092/m.27008 type:complete len:208 (-) Transcript_9092:551-1174(-)